MVLLLDQLGGIWEIIFNVNAPKALPTIFKRSPDLAFRHKPPVG
jgi:hypothetical protein